MLLKIELENFFSIKNRIFLDFIAAKSNCRQARDLSYNVIDWNGTKVLKTIGLFGPNASGKSNILKAINASKKNHELEATSGGLIMAKQRTASPSRRMKAA